MKQTLLCLTLINFYICIVYGSATNYPCGGDNWIAFKDEKCFKLIKKFATGDEARKICNQEYLQSDSSLPTLASINSAAEQEYLTKFIFDTSGIKISVWIGANRTENVSQFVWDDGSAFDFTNWAEGRPYEEIGMDCVEMQSRYTRKFSDITDSNLHSINGKWKDVACEKANYVLCQKLQIWSLQHLQKTFLDSRKELQDSFKDMTNQLNDTRNQLDNTKKELTTTKNDLTTTINELTNTKNELEVLQKNPIPIGFIYVQLPGQPEPWSLWGSVDWIEITSEYAGLFFRVLGGNSAHFGEMQNEDSPRLTEVDSSFNGNDHRWHASITPGHWSERIRAGGPGGDGTHHMLTLLVSSAEVRPYNTAIRIWKRTK